MLNYSGISFDLIEWATENAILCFDKKEKSFLFETNGKSVTIGNKQVLDIINDNSSITIELSESLVCDTTGSQTFVGLVSIKVTNIDDAASIYTLVILEY